MPIEHFFSLSPPNTIPTSPPLSGHRRYLELALLSLVLAVDVPVPGPVAADIVVGVETVPVAGELQEGEPGHGVAAAAG
jgi:hypothetical protein